jgi:hypothetical protein
MSTRRSQFILRGVGAIQGRHVAFGPVGLPSWRARQRLPDHRPGAIERALAIAGVDFPADHGQPAALWFTVATVAALAGSLAADAILVAIGTSVFPALTGYVHFRFSDYGKLTVIGVVIACLAWPVVTWVSSTARRLFFRLAIVVTLVLWIPDLWILAQGQPVKAVLVLMAMHVAIALVTYNVLVHLAPARPPRPGPTP